MSRVGLLAVASGGIPNLRNLVVCNHLCLQRRNKLNSKLENLLEISLATSQNYCERVHTRVLGAAESVNGCLAPRLVYEQDL